MYRDENKNLRSFTNRVRVIDSSDVTLMYISNKNDIELPSNTVRTNEWTFINNTATTTLRVYLNANTYDYVSDVVINMIYSMIPRNTQPATLGWTNKIWKPSSSTASMGLFLTLPSTNNLLLLITETPNGTLG